MRAVAVAAFLVWAWPARATRLCGSVSVDGRPLPEGLVSAGRGLVRFRGGRFCLEDLAPGRRRVEAFAPSSLTPVAVEPSVELPSAGAELALSYRRPVAGRRACRLRAVVSAPPAALEAAAASPALFAAAVGDDDKTAAVILAWARSDGRTLSVDVPSPAGRVGAVDLRLPGWGVETYSPRLWAHDGAPLTCPAGGSLILSFSLKPAAALRGTVFGPDGRPFAASPSRRLKVLLESFVGDDMLTAFADEEGRYEIPNTVAGFRLASFVGGGDGFDVSASTAAGLWLSAGAQARLDARLSEPAELAVDSSGLEPVPGVRPGVHNAVERRLVGLPAGSWSADAAAKAFFPEELDVVLVQDESGRWKPVPGVRNPPPAEGGRFSAGRYDLLAFEVTHPLERPALRLIAERRDVALPPRRLTRVSLPRAAESGPATLRVAVRRASPPSAAALASARSFAELYAALAPQVSVFAEDGRFVAAAFRPFSLADLGALRAALDARDAAALARVLGPGPHHVEISGLTPGRYRVLVGAAGAAPRELRIALAAGGGAELAVDLDAPPGGTLEGRVVFAGRTLPHDEIFVVPDERSWPGDDDYGGGRPHPGGASRTLATADGRFALDGLPPGNYRARAEFRYGSFYHLDAGAFAGRISVPERGGALLYDERGRRLSGELALEVAPPAPAAGKAAGLFRGKVAFPARVDLVKEPLFFTAHPLDASFPSGLAAVGPGPAGPSFRMPVTAGASYILNAHSTRWGVAYALPQTDTVIVGTAPVDIELRVEPAGSVTGRVELPDGRPYRPDARQTLWLRLTPDAMAFDRQVNADGTFDIIGLPSGTYLGEAYGVGDFPWLAPPLERLRVEAGRTTEAVLRLSAAAAVRLAKPPPIAPLPGRGSLDQRQYGFEPERWVRALPAGTPLDRSAAMRLQIRELHGPFQFSQGSNGAWESHLSASGRARAAPGRYDVYLLEESLAWDSPSQYVKVLARQPGVRIAEGRDNALDLGALSPAAGSLTLAGAIRGLPAPDEGRLAAVQGDMLRLMEDWPSLELRGPGGWPAVFAWPRPAAMRGDRGFGAFTAALASGRFAELRAMLEGAPHEFELPGLPAGDYDVVVRAPGCRERRFRLRLARPEDGRRDFDLTCRPK